MRGSLSAVFENLILYMDWIYILHANLYLIHIVIIEAGNARSNPEGVALREAILQEFQNLRDETRTNVCRIVRSDRCMWTCKAASSPVRLVWTSIGPPPRAARLSARFRLSQPTCRYRRRDRGRGRRMDALSARHGRRRLPEHVPTATVAGRCRSADWDWDDDDVACAGGREGTAAIASSNKLLSPYGMHTRTLIPAGTQAPALSLSLLVCRWSSSSQHPIPSWLIPAASLLC